MARSVFPDVANSGNEPRRQFMLELEFRRFASLVRPHRIRAGRWPFGRIINCAPLCQDSIPTDRFQNLTGNGRIVPS